MTISLTWEVNHETDELEKALKQITRFISSEKTAFGEKTLALIHQQEIDGPDEGKEILN